MYLTYEVSWFMFINVFTKMLSYNDVVCIWGSSYGVFTKYVVNIPFPFTNISPLHSHSKEELDAWSNSATSFVTCKRHLISILSIANWLEDWLSDKKIETYFDFVLIGNSIQIAEMFLKNAIKIIIYNLLEKDEEIFLLSLSYHYKKLHICVFKTEWIMLK